MGSFRFSDADRMSVGLITDPERWVHTLQVEEHIRLIVLKHLRYKLDVHVLNIDLLSTFCSELLIHIHESANATWRFLFIINTASFSFSWHNRQRSFEHMVRLSHTMFVMIRDSRRLCCCSWGLSCHCNQYAIFQTDIRYQPWQICPQERVLCRKLPVGTIIPRYQQPLLGNHSRDASVFARGDLSLL